MLGEPEYFPLELLPDLITFVYVVFRAGFGVCCVPDSTQSDASATVMVRGFLYSPDYRSL